MGGGQEQLPVAEVPAARLEGDALGTTEDSLEAAVKMNQLLQLQGDVQV